MLQKSNSNNMLEFVSLFIWQNLNVLHGIVTDGSEADKGLSGDLSGSSWVLVGETEDPIRV